MFPDRPNICRGKEQDGALGLQLQLVTGNVYRLHNIHKIQSFIIKSEFGNTSIFTYIIRHSNTFTCVYMPGI